MRQQTKYIWLRNLSLLSICGYLSYSLFPAPQLIWRLFFLGIAFLTIIPNLTKLSRIEWASIAFGILHVIYFFVSYSWLDSPSTTHIGNISTSLLAIPLFMTLGRKGVMTTRFYLIATIALILSSLVYFWTMKTEYLLNLINGNEDITNNASVAFLLILPQVFIIRNRFLSYAVLLVCIYFILDAAKRGNIVCAVPIILLYVSYSFRNKQVRFYEKMIFIVFFMFAVFWGFKQYEQNEYLQRRTEQTLKGYSSGRDQLFENSWKVYSESQSVMNILLGYGYQATINNKQIGNYAHNDWLELLVDNGLVGALFYLYIFVLLFKMIRKEKILQKRYVLLSIAAIWVLKSLFSMTFSAGTTFMLFMLFGYVYHKEENSFRSLLTMQKG